MHVGDAEDTIYAVYGCSAFVGCGGGLDPSHGHHSSNSHGAVWTRCPDLRCVLKRKERQKVNKWGCTELIVGLSRNRDFNFRAFTKLSLPKIIVVAWRMSRNFFFKNVTKCNRRYFCYGVTAARR